MHKWWKEIELKDMDKQQWESVGSTAVNVDLLKCM